MHVPVMLAEVIERLAVPVGGICIDGTSGGGGHTAELLARVGAHGRVLAIDQDADAVARLRARFSTQPACVVVHGSFAEMAEIAARHGVVAADGILLDLGVSSDQLDTPERGFSFMRDGPLDMRMNRSAETTAEAIVNTWSAAALTDALRVYGEEPRAARVARAVERARAEKRLTGTLELAEIVSRALGGRRGPTHPATRTFQALRMAVNREMESLETGLEVGIALLKPGGRMAVITFHSIEDRAVKSRFAAHVGRWESLQQGGQVWRGETPALGRITRKPVVADGAEVEANPRARSAKLRVVERLGGNESHVSGDAGARGRESQDGG